VSTGQNPAPIKDHSITEAVNQLRDIAIEFGESAQLRERIAAVVVPLLQAPPIDMILHCPNCRLPHVDEPDQRTPDWKNPPHRSHLCHGCRHVWRPADVPTNGVKAIQTRGSNDSPIVERAPASAQEGQGLTDVARLLEDLAKFDGSGGMQAVNELVGRAKFILRQPATTMGSVAQGDEATRLGALHEAAAACLRSTPVGTDPAPYATCAQAVLGLAATPQPPADSARFGESVGDDAKCKRCSGEAMIYVEDTMQPCPDCQDLSDYHNDVGESVGEDEPLLPEMDSLADIDYAQTTPDDWDADYRSTWQKLQVAERNKMQWRTYALKLRTYHAHMMRQAEEKGATSSSAENAHETAETRMDTDFGRDVNMMSKLGGAESDDEPPLCERLALADCAAPQNFDIAIKINDLRGEHSKVQCPNGCTDPANGGAGCMAVTGNCAMDNILCKMGGETIESREFIGLLVEFLTASPVSTETQESEQAASKRALIAHIDAFVLAKLAQARAADGRFDPMEQDDWDKLAELRDRLQIVTRLPYTVFQFAIDRINRLYKERDDARAAGGSVEGIDLDKLETLAQAATRGPWMRLFGDRTVYDRMKDGCRGIPIVRASKRTYPLDIQNVGEDTYTLMSKGHHDPDEFMRHVRADGYDWPLGMPKHIWLRCIPPPPGYVSWYIEAKEGSRGAFPATQCWEAYGDETYEAIIAKRHSADEEAQKGQQ
jgi:hypothetical protein